MKKVVLVFVLSVVTNIAFSQAKYHFIDLSTGFNRIGFYNEIGYKFELNCHQLKIGARHYTLDNFFETNAIGMDLRYGYKVLSQNQRLYFCPGVSATFFKEKKNNANVTLSDIKLVNQLGINLKNSWSVFYELGMGVIMVKSDLINVNEISNLEYFNYEISLGVSYKIGHKK